ncbi:MAG: ATP-binding protein, partial [Pseudomonadota bacterium]
PENFETLHEIVGSYAIKAGLEVDPGIMTHDFYERLTAAGAYRWGLVFKLTIGAIGAAKVAGAQQLRIEHFIDKWVSKTQTNRAATPFTHSSFQTMYRKDHPFVEALTG